MAHAVSPELVTGVDCRLPTKSGAKSRGVGTVAARAVVASGRVLQGSTRVRIERGEPDRRLPWSHYLSRPGVVETVGKAETADIAGGFLAGSTPVESLDLGAVSDRMIAKVQANQKLDHLAPFRSTRTRMVWCATTSAGPGRAAFTLEDQSLRTFELTVPEDGLDAVVGLCEDLALHDWVLTTVLRLVERSDLGSGHAAISRLRPVIDHLLHLWMPGAHVPDLLLGVWEGLERKPGFTRQWQAVVTRIRDQLALQTLVSLRPRTTDGETTRQRGGVGVSP